MAKDYGLNAAGLSADIQRGDLVRFWPEDLIPNDRNYRLGSFDTDPRVVAVRDDQIERMVESLIRERQKQPLGVHEVSGLRFKVHYGDTRYWAFVRINQRRIWPWGKPEDGGRARVECKVEKFSVNVEKEIFGSSIVENLSRNNLTEIDVCIAVSRAEELGYTPSEIMAKFHITDPAWLPNMHRLALLPDERKREIHLGILKASVGYLLAEIPEQFHAEILAEAAAPEPVQYVSTETEAEGIRDVIEAEAAEPTLDYSESQSPPPPAGKTSKPAKAKKVTARGVATAARKRGLLAHKKISKTVAGIREFWAPIAADRKGSLVARLASAELAWIDGDTSDEDHWKEVLALLKAVK